MKWIPKFSVTFESSWRVVSTVLIITAALALLLFARLDTMLPGYGPNEVATAQSSSSLGVIRDNPVNAPFKLVAYAIGEITERPIFATRVTAAIFGAITIILFYFGVRHWHSGRISFLATVLFASSAWFLHVARFGETDIMVPFSILLLATAGYRVASREKSSLGYIAVLLAIGASLFVPGIIWFILGALLIRRGKDLKAIARHFSALQICGLVALILVGVLMPIGLALASQPSIAMQLLGLPNTFPQPLQFLQNVALVPVSLFAFSNSDPQTWLSTLPYLDIFTSAMVVLGLYYYFKYRSLDRAKLLVVFLLFGIVLIALGGINDSILLPGIYIAAAGGIALLLSQWMTVFPVNPLAQTVGIVMITIAVLFSCVYNLRAYFVAWPNASETKAIYEQQPNDLLQ